MSSPIHHMDITRYSTDGLHWDSERVTSPLWSDVEAAVRRMDNYCLPNVYLNTVEDDENEDTFCVCGGAGRWALFRFMGGWQYEDPTGGEQEARLWESDQGYYCREMNILADIEKVLRIVKAFHETGSYVALDSVR